MKTISVFPNGSLDIGEEAIQCPYCQSKIVPYFIHAESSYPDKCTIFCKCTNTECTLPFIAVFSRKNGHLKFDMILPPPTIKLEFPIEITEISLAYTQIYNEAYVAEQMGLNQICGVGYRKALEFLIKDYLMQLHPDQEEVIKKMALAKCISDKIKNENIKNVAQRATWLGNDETHYIRIWENKDVSDLKELIEITSLWIDMEMKTKKILENMPSNTQLNKNTK